MKREDEYLRDGTFNDRFGDELENSQKNRSSSSIKSGVGIGRRSIRQDGGIKIAMAYNN